MTTTSDKARGVLLAALMVLSVFAFTVSFAGTAGAAATALTLDNTSPEPGEPVTPTVTADSTTNDVFVVLDADRNGSMSPDDPVISVPISTASTATPAGSAFDTSSLDDTTTYTVYALQQASAPANGDDLTTGVPASLTTQATSTPSVTGAVEYTPVSTGTAGTIEVTLDEQLASVSEVSFTILGEGETAATGTFTGTNRFTITNTGGDILPVETVWVDVVGQDAAGNTINANVSVTLTATTADATGASGTTTLQEFQGAPIALDFGATETYELYQDEDPYLGPFGTGANSNVAVFNTSAAEAGSTYNVLVDSGGDGFGDTNVTDITLRRFSIGITAPDTTDEDPVGATVTSSSSDRSVAVVLLNSDGDGVAGAAGTTGANGQTTVSFPAQDTGNYTVLVQDRETGVTATDTLTVGEPTPGAANLASTIMTDQRGDVIPITVNYAGGATGANITIGTPDVNFNVSVEVSDADEDGQTTILFNTFATDTLVDSLTGGTQPALDLPSDSGDEITTVKVHDGVTSPIDPGEYPVSVDTGGSESSVGTIIVEERSSTGISAHTAPSSADIDDLASLRAAMSAEDGSVAQGDQVIIQIGASGVFGFITDADDITPGSGNGVSLVFVEQDATINKNEDGVTFVPTSSNGELFRDPQNDSLYFVTSESALGADIDDQFTVVWNASDVNAVTETTEINTTSFSIAEPTLDISVGGSTLVMPPSENSTITGTSSLAPGTAVTVRLRSIGGASPFTLQTSPPVRVQPDGTWRATFNLSGKADGQQFTATASAGGLTDTAEGQVGSVSAQVAMSDQQAQQAGSLVVVDTVTLSQGGFVAIHEGSAGGPVIGNSQYLEAGTHQNVRIRLDADSAVTGTQTLVAMPHRDTDGDRSYDFGISDDDGPYVDDAGAPIVDDAQVSLSTPTATVTPTDTPTDTPTATPTQTATQTDTETPPPEDGDGDGDGDGIPGFGAGLAVIALLGAALLAARRRS